MSTMTDQKVDVRVDVFTKSVTYIVNCIFQVFLRISNLRDLPAKYIITNRSIIENGLFCWNSERSLKSGHLEIISPDGSRVLERWDISLSYSDSPNEEVKKPPVDQIADFCKNLKKLPKLKRKKVPRKSNLPKNCIVIQTIRLSPGSVLAWLPTLALNQFSFVCFL